MRHIDTARHLRFAAASLVLAAGSWSAAEARAEVDEEGAAVEAAAPAAQAGEAPAARPPGAGPARAVPERVARLGRVESILLENDDPESAFDFGQELLRDHGEDGRLRLLLGAAAMRLGRHAEAAEQFDRAAEATEPVIRLHALYNVGRARQAEGQLAQAIQAYERYVAFARSNESLPSFVGEAERLISVLRSRLAAESAPRPAARRRPAR